MQESDVEKFCKKLTEKFGVDVQWSTLDQMQKQMMIQGINTILHVIATQQQKG
jgi:hypothetical protein